MLGKTAVGYDRGRGSHVVEQRLSEKRLTRQRSNSKNAHTPSIGTVVPLVTNMYVQFVVCRVRIAGCHKSRNWRSFSNPCRPTASLSPKTRKLNQSEAEDLKAEMVPWSERRRRTGMPKRRFTSPTV